MGRAHLLGNVTFDAWSEPQTIEGLAAYRSGTYRETRGPRYAATRLHGAAVSPALFSLLRAVPAAGRFFDADDVRAEASPAVVISHRFWQDRFGGDPGAIGRTLTLEDSACTIVGVAAPEFYFPDHDTLLWRPLQMPGPSEGGSVFSAIARLRPGVTPAQAGAEGTAAARSSARPAAMEIIFGRGGPVVVHALPAAGRDDRAGAARPGRAHRRERLRAAHRVRERGPPAARPGRGARAGAGGAHGARREPGPTRPADPDREPALLARRRSSRARDGVRAPSAPSRPRSPRLPPTPETFGSIPWPSPSPLSRRSRPASSPASSPPLAGRRSRSLPPSGMGRGRPPGAGPAGWGVPFSPRRRRWPWSFS